MVPVIVPVYAALLAVIFIVLSARVIGARQSTKVAIGHGGFAMLERRMRVQANFAEYVPLALLLITFVEMQGWPHWLVHLLCIALLVACMVYGYGVSQENEDIRFRVAGVVTTFGVMAVAALGLLIRAAGV